MNFMQGTAIPLDQRSLDAFEIGLHRDPPLLLVHGQPMDSIRIALCSSTIVFVCARLAHIWHRVPSTAIYRFFLLLFSLFLSSPFHWRIVVKIYVKSSWKRAPPPYTGG